MCPLFHSNWTHNFVLKPNRDGFFMVRISSKHTEDSIWMYPRIYSWRAPQHTHRAWKRDTERTKWKHTRKTFQSLLPFLSLSIHSKKMFNGFTMVGIHFFRCIGRTGFYIVYTLVFPIKSPIPPFQLWLCIKSPPHCFRLRPRIDERRKKLHAHTQQIPRTKNTISEPK